MAGLRAVLKASPPRKGEDEALEAMIEEARAERDRHVPLQEDVLRLVGGGDREKIVHDLRNILNDIALLEEITGGPH